MIKGALRAIRFNGVRGYYFATELNGVSQLFADKPHLEGKNLLGMRDSDGRYVVKDQINIAREQKEGYYRYSWTKPGVKGKDYPKIAFIKYFEPFDWYIGTGEYLDDVVKDIQEEVLARIEQIRFGKDRYIFVGQWDGLSMTGPAKGRNMYDVKDINGLAVVQELIAASKTGGGFVHYMLPVSTGKEPAAKLSYVQGIDDWQWYIGSGVLVEEIDQIIARRGMELRREINEQIFISILILLGLLVFIVLIERIVAKRIEKSIMTFSMFFDKAATKSIKIEADAGHFSEFSVMAHLANEMIEKRKQSKDALRKSEATLSSIFNAAPIGIGLVSNQVIKQANENCCKMIGYSKEELLEKNAEILYQDPDEFKKVGREINDQIQRTGTGAIETKWDCKDGSIIDVLLSYAVVDPENNSLITFTVLDISDRMMVANDRKRLEASRRAHV